MGRSIVRRLISRLVVLALASSVVNAFVVPRLDIEMQGQGRLALVVIVTILSWLYIVPPFRDLLGQSPNLERGRPSSVGAVVTTVETELPKRKISFLGAYRPNVLAGLFTVVLWLVIACIAAVELVDGDVVSLLRGGTLGTSMIAAVTILVMRVSEPFQRGMCAVLVHPRVLIVLLVAMGGWWIAPLVILVLLPTKFSFGLQALVSCLSPECGSQG